MLESTFFSELPLSLFAFCIDNALLHRKHGSTSTLTTFYYKNHDAPLFHSYYIILSLFFKKLQEFSRENFYVKSEYWFVKY